MRWLRFLLLMVVVTIALEALYRWANGLVLDWGWLGYRVAFLTFLFSFQTWLNRRETRRERRFGTSDNGVLLPVFAMLTGTGGLVFCAWNTIDALRTGRVIVSTTPEAYTTWSANPWGFAMAFGLGVFGVLMFLFLFLGGWLLLWQAYLRRRGPA